MEKDIQILVVDDHQVVREGLRRMLGEEKDMELVGQGANGEEALFQVEILSPNIVLLDIKMPGVDGIELTRQLRQKYPSCKVIILTFYDEFLTQAIEAGAKGYLLKDTKREELIQAIKQVHRGEIVISESLTLKHSKKTEESLVQEDISSDTMLDEVQLILPPPIEANQLMRFTSQLEDILQSRVLQVVGSWQEGTAVTISLNNAALVADILNKLREISEIEAIEEKALTGETIPKLLKKAAAVPRLKNKPRKTIFVTLEKDYVGTEAKQRD